MNNIFNLRKMQWKLGRRLYMKARGEASRNLPATSGEVYVQKCVVLASKTLHDVVIFDVGANRGQWTSQLLTILHSESAADSPVRIFSFEPAPASQKVFSDCIAKLPGNDQVSLLSLALSDSPGKAQFAIWSDTAGTNTLAFEKGSLSRAKDVIEVEVDTIDSVVKANNLSHLHLVKIDAEGNDAKVIFGAAHCLANEIIDIVQFEYNGRWINSRNYLKDVFDVISGTPYTLGKVRNDYLEIYECWHPELERFFEANYVLIHPRAREWFTVASGEIGKGNVFVQSSLS